MIDNKVYKDLDKFDVWLERTVQAHHSTEWNQVCVDDSLHMMTR